MPHIITDACIKDMLCVQVCLTKAIHPKADEPAFATATQLYVNPKKCGDCGSCVAVCETGAVFAEEDLPEDKLQFKAINAAFFKN